MTKITTAFLFAASISFIAACDPAEDPVTERSAEVEAPTKPGEAHDRDGHHGKRGDRGKFAAEKLCSEIACTDDQAAQVLALFTSRPHERRDKADREAHKTERDAAHKALADAFRAESFDVSVLERVAPPRDHGDRDDHMIAFATELHAILTAEQRAKLADEVAERGPLFMGRGGHHGHHGPKGVDGGEHGDRVAKHVDKLCEQVTCTAEQATQLTATLAGAREARHEAREQHDQPDFTAFAELFRADTLDAAKLRASMDAAKAEHDARKAERGKQMGAVVAEIHGILTPEQRAIVANMIEQHGIGALMHGPRDGKRGKHGKRGKGKGKDKADNQLD